jgi:hypothetical protein
MTRLRLVNLGAKSLLVVLLLHALLFPDLPQYVAKGMPYRLALYPLSALLVPVVVWLRRRRAADASVASRPYPDLIDLCAVLPFLIDTSGNAANLYDTVSWWDDLMHVLTWIPLVVAFGLALRHWPNGRLVTAGLTIAFGAVTHILWETGEYLTFVAHSPTESASAYRDTIGDLNASLLGTLIGAFLVSIVLWDLGTRPDRAAPQAP